ncbi:Zea mays Retrotransposon Opie-2 [Phytophthora megakarya]|uniref:Zea mays Retrotransposon Opie-2 n=1 Tax=Phytophthora megakarya TaxID=4795 RepID=A0A225UX75_9STRA|nr:Zea mays Retrotransposon Opie-2 [Phytophthora megakarya]
MPDSSWFKGSLTPGPSHTFTYGNGTVLYRSFKGTIKLNVLNPKRCLSALTLSDVSYASKCDSNLLSAYYLANQGYRHFYAQTRKFAENLKEWHLKLGHVRNERLIRTISNQKISKATKPLHKLHMDSTGKLKVSGQYGSFSYRYALAVIDDTTAYKWYIKSLKEVSGKFRSLLKNLAVQFIF